MPINAFLVQGNMIKHKTLPFYETCILNYDIRRRTNPAKVKEFMYEQGTIRPIMHAGNLWDKIKNGFKKLKNGLTKTMDFVDNNEVLKGFKDSALNYLGQKTGVDVNKIYDTTHQIMDALPEYQIDPTPESDPVAYFNQRQEMYKNQYPSNQYQNYSNQYQYPSNQYQNYSYPSSYQYNSTPTTTQPQNYSYQQPTNNSFQNQLTNTYNQLQNQPLSQPQKQTVKKNFDLFSSGLKSCGMDIKTALNMNKTLMKNIPKMLMMGVNASTGKISIHKDFKPILEKFGHHSLLVPKTIKDLMDKIHIPMDRLEKFNNTMKPVAPVIGKTIRNPATVGSTGRLNLGRGETELAGNNNERVNTAKSTNQLSSTNNNAPNRIKPSSEPATGKKSRYADILAKLTKK